MTDYKHRPTAGVAGQLSSLADPPLISSSRRPAAGKAPAEPAPTTPTDGPVAVYSAVSPGGGSKPRKPVRLPTLARMKRKGTRITAVTCYDATFARLVDDAHIDVVLVGDSLGNVIQGQESTLPVTLDDILYHCRSVRRGLRRAHLVADMPFMTYHSVDVALPNAARLMAEGGAHAVKLEGGADVAPTIARLVGCGIPVMAHIGLTPQSVHAMGGHKIQGRGFAARASLLADARAVEAAGAYAVVLEGIPARLAAEVTDALTIPTIGIGAGVGCDGQILVLYDMLGLNPEFTPKFLKRFAELGALTRAALSAYRTEVRSGDFPGQEHEYHDPKTDLDSLPLKAVP
ncbi:MAG: 3-methyl-2-oxobutanoate hydroxymethyltransferase [Myxococcales bacterium]|nr:3-methyl-2-oxobutanoate hydroxymethyltransferase [Myxococcales bacterium]